MNNKTTTTLSLILLALLVLSKTVWGFSIDTSLLNSATTKPKVAVISFYVDNKTNNLYQDLQSEVSSYLNRSYAVDVFNITDRVININTNLQKLNIDLSVYKDYDFVMFGKFYFQNNVYIVQTAIYNTKTASVVSANQYQIDKNNIGNSVTRLYQELANEIYTASTGLQGYFASSLVYIANGNQLMVADFNGNNSKVLISSKHNLYAPTVHNASTIAYVALEEGISKIYIYNLLNNSNNLLASFTGLSLAPKFSSNGSKLVFTLANNGSTRLIEVDLSTGNYKVLLKSAFINLAGDFIDDNTLLYYSDKAGANKLYTLNLNTLDSQQVSKQSGNYFTPSYSKIYSLVAFTKILNGSFAVGVMDLSGREKIITQESFAENPSWAADSRHLIYQYVYKKTAERNFNAFMFLDVLTGNKTNIQIQESITDPVLSKNPLFINGNVVKYNLLNIN